MKFSSRYAFYVLALKKVLMQQNSKNKIARLRQQCRNWNGLNDMPVLGLAGCHWRKRKLVQVRRLASQSVSPDQMGVFVGSGPKWSAATPAYMARKLLTKTQNKQKEVLHLCRWSTHTHPAGAGATLKGKRKEKANTDDGQKAKTAQGGGEQTDLQNQPTRRNGPDQNSAHT